MAGLTAFVLTKRGFEPTPVFAHWTIRSPSRPDEPSPNALLRACSGDAAAKLTVEIPAANALAAGRYQFTGFAFTAEEAKKIAKTNDIDLSRIQSWPVPPSSAAPAEPPRGP